MLNPATQELVVKEGELLSVAVASLGGNPVPSHQCWLNGSLVSMTEKNITNDEQLLVTNFSVTSVSQMNKGHVVCSVTQEGQPDMTEYFSQLVTVYYTANNLTITHLPDVVYQDDSVSFSVSSTYGNPHANLSCNASYGKMISTVPDLISAHAGYQTTHITYIPDRRDTEVQCTAVQKVRLENIFSTNRYQNISVLYLSKNSMIISPQHPVKEGSTVNVTLVSSGGRPAVTGFQCWILDTELSSVSSSIKTEATERMFSFDASRKHNNHNVTGKFVQDPRLTTFLNATIIVYYPADKPEKVQLPQTVLRANLTVQFSLNVSDPGNPIAKQFCFIGGRQIRKQTEEKNVTSIWHFKPEVGDNKRNIICHIIQTGSNNSCVYNQTVVSEILDVTYPSNSSWTATQPLEVREGELLSVRITSHGGNPVPSHQCWLQSAKKYNLEKVDQHEKALHITNFSVNSIRQMNKGSLECIVSQDGQPDLLWPFSQNVSVLFNSTVDMSALGFNKTHIAGSITVTAGNPPPISINCSVSTGDNSLMTLNMSDLQDSTTLVWNSSLIELGLPGSTGVINISCQVTQASQQLSKLHFRSISYYIPVKPSIHSGSTSLAAGVSAGLLAVVAVAVTAAAVLFYLRRRRCGGLVSVPVASNKMGKNGKKRPQAIEPGRLLEIELEKFKEFKKGHPLYSDPGMEYFTVVKGQPSLVAASSLSASTDTIYLSIVGHLETDDQTLVRHNSNNELADNYE